MHTYYIVQTGPDRYDMRQTRYAGQYKAGEEHPHDLMAAGFDATGLRDMLAKYSPGESVDLSALPTE